MEKNREKDQVEDHVLEPRLDKKIMEKNEEKDRVEDCALEPRLDKKIMEKNKEKDRVEDCALEPRINKRQGIVVSYTPKKKHKVVDKPFLEYVVNFVKKNRPRSLTKEEKLDILSVQAKFRYEHVMLHSNNRPGQMKKNVDATNRTANLLGRSNKLCSEIWTKFVETGEISEQKMTGNRNPKASVVPDLHLVTSIIQKFIRDRQVTHTRTVARDVMDCCIENGFIAVDRDQPKQVQAALRSVQRFLKRKGYRRGKKKGMMCYKLRAENICKRDLYTVRLVSLNAAKERRIVYMGESYIHKNYVRHDDSLYDPNDEQDQQVKMQHKEKRYCFIAAIIDADYTLPEESRNENQVAHLMQDTLHVFVEGKQTKNYQGMFDHKYFVEWMEKLFKALDDRGISNAVIVMDNAKYHTNLPESTPKGSWKKAQMQAACQERGIPFEAGDQKCVLWEKLREYNKLHVLPVVCSMARERGHEVIFSPSHHFDLQPIELVWAIVKGEVGRQYTTITTFEQVLARLYASFRNMESKTVQGCINSANSHLIELYEHIRATEDYEESEDEVSDGESNTSGSSDEDYSNK